MTRARPARPWAPIPISVFVLVVWWVVAHNSGSGWVQFLGDAVFGAVVVGILGPAVDLSRTQIRVLTAPTDGSAGMPTAVLLCVSRRTRVTPIEPPGPAVLLGPAGRRQQDDAALTLVPHARGVHHRMILDVASAAPFGLQWWSRRVTVTLPAALHVAPRRGAPVGLPKVELGTDGDHSRLLPTPLGDSRGVRQYRPGDQRRRVHWPSTAHTGQLMVRETEEPSTHPLTLKVGLPFDPVAAERAAERAFGTAIAILDRGSGLIMVTDEQTGPTNGSIASRQEAGRRLARAVAAEGSNQIEILR